MSEPQHPPRRSNASEIMRYASLGAQIFVSLGIAVFAGLKLDGWTRSSFPLFVWLLPFAVLALMIYKMVKETSKKKK